MPVIAQTIITDAQSLLNDTGGAIYSSTVLVPLAARAYRELQAKLIKRGLAPIKELTAAPITVTAGTIALGDGSGLPSDLIEPLSMEERPAGSMSVEDFRPMEELDWEPDVTKTERLRWWVWREEQIKFLGANANVEVKIKYRKGLPPITDVNSPLAVIGCESFLGLRTAELASIYIGSNPSRAESLRGEKIEALDDLIGTLVKKGQTMPIRRRRNRFRVD